MIVIMTIDSTGEIMLLMLDTCFLIFVKVALYSFLNSFSLSFMFSLRHVFSSTVGPNDTQILMC